MTKSYVSRLPARKNGRLAPAYLVIGGLVAMLTVLAAHPALAQIKPASSGDLSFHEPEMRRHRSGLYRPNRPHRSRRHRHHARSIFR